MCKLSSCYDLIHDDLVSLVSFLWKKQIIKLEFEFDLFGETTISISSIKTYCLRNTFWLGFRPPILNTMITLSWICLSSWKPCETSDWFQYAWWTYWKPICLDVHKEIQLDRYYLLKKTPSLASLSLRESWLMIALNKIMWQHHCHCVDG